MADPRTTWVLLTRHGKAVRTSITRADEAGGANFMGFHAFGLEDADRMTLDDGVALADWETASAQIRGELKWDGCINWETDPKRMMHGCGPGHVEEIAAILSTVYHVGKRHMDLLDEDAPPMPDGAIEIIDEDLPPGRIAMG